MSKIITCSNQKVLVSVTILPKDNYRNICKYFGVDHIEELISVRQSKFVLRYCASEVDICRAISMLYHNRLYVYMSEQCLRCAIV